MFYNVGNYWNKTKNIQYGMQIVLSSSMLYISQLLVVGLLEFRARLRSCSHHLQLYCRK